MSNVESCVVFRDPRYDREDSPPAPSKRHVGAADVEFFAPVDLRSKETTSDTTARWLVTRGCVPATIARFEKTALLCCDNIRKLPKAVGKLPLERLLFGFLRARTPRAQRVVEVVLLRELDLSSGSWDETRSTTHADAGYCPGYCPGSRGRGPTRRRHRESC